MDTKNAMSTLSNTVKNVKNIESTKINNTKKSKKYICIDAFLSKHTVCKNANRCTDKNCKFVHNKKTRMCKFADKCRRGNQCTFAHSESEIYVPDCKFALRCKNENCKFRHPEPNFWKIEEEKKENNVENLKQNNFPSTIKINVEDIKTLQSVNYQEMKNIIKKIDSITIKNKSIDEMIEDYECVKEFNSVTFKLD